MFENKEELVNWLKSKELYKDDIAIKEHYNIDNLIESFILYYASNNLYLTFYYEPVYSFEYRLAL